MCTSWLCKSVMLDMQSAQLTPVNGLVHNQNDHQQIWCVFPSGRYDMIQTHRSSSISSLITFLTFLEKALTLVTSPSMTMSEGNSSAAVLPIRMYEGFLRHHIFHIPKECLAIKWHQTTKPWLKEPGVRLLVILYHFWYLYHLSWEEKAPKYRFYLFLVYVIKMFHLPCQYVKISVAFTHL